jgi:hypothetical protein
MNHDFQTPWQNYLRQDHTAQPLDAEVVQALWSWLEVQRAQSISQFGSGSAATYSEAVERSHGMAHHVCMAKIREQLQSAVALLTDKRPSNPREKMRDIDAAFARSLPHETELKKLIGWTEQLRDILQHAQNDLQHHSAALAIRLPQWRASAHKDNPLNDETVRNETAERRAQSIAALIQSSHTSQLQLSLMYRQMSRLLENLSTLRQVTYPIWQQQSIHQTMADDSAFLASLQQTLSAV